MLLNLLKNFFRELLPEIRRKLPLSLPKKMIKIGENSNLNNLDGKLKKEQTSMQVQVLIKYTNLIKFNKKIFP